MPAPSFCAYARLVRRETGSALRGLRFAVRSALRCRTTKTWLSFMESNACLAQARDRVRSVLADKIHRPFSHCAYGPAARARLLMNHYEIARSAFSPERLLKLVNGERLILAQLTDPKTGETYVFTLAREMISQHQGEFTFRMMDAAQTLPLAMLMANLTYDDAGRKILLLNGIQGPGAEYKSLIVRLTRNFAGLRPKRAVVEVAYAFSRAVGLDGIVAIAKANHVSQAKRKWARKIHAAYDDFWCEFDPAVLPSGDYAMPAEPPRRNVEDVIPKKRKNWLERQSFLTALAEQTQAAAAFFRA